ncbi:hypothetical protein [Natronorubrum texcoconense]|uniref:hypothetical protein n=1 Tax=Natronorubrum texcoconense TaxID=1095776 RepID=UPI001113B45C|nr:hypothetical protein [Natronorubrum texcoconense]
MKSEPDWGKVLEEIYSEDLVWEADVDIDMNHPVVATVDMDPEAVKRCLAFLSQTGLIGRVQVGLKADVSRPGKEGVIGTTKSARIRGTHIGLTERGFLVAHQRQMQEQQQNREDERSDRQDSINYIIGLLTFGLLSITVLDSAAYVFVNQGSYLSAYLTVGGGIILVALIAISLVYIDPFSQL